MKRNCILAALAALMICATAFADQPFRNHRYDALGVLPVHHGDIVFVGNSITNMHEWWEAFGCTQNILNRGVSGCVSSETLENIGGIVAGKPAKVFLMVGTNDLGTTGLDDPQAILANVKETVARFKAGSPETQIYIQSVLPVAEGNSRSAESIISLNALYKELCEAEGLTYVDLWSKLVEPGTTHINPAYSLDGLHLYPSGYKVWCEEIAPYVGADCSYVEGELDNCDLPGSFAMRAAAFGWLPLDEDDIVIIGDEMVHGGEWHELLGSPRFRNRGTCWGFGGPMIQTIQDELPAIFKSGKSPEQIYLHIGAAEVANNAPLDSILVRYRRLADDIKAAAPGSKLFLMTPQPVYYSHNKTADADSVNAGIKAIADELGAGFVDIHTPLCKDGRGDINYVNGNYVYGKGYLKIARVLAESMGLPVVPVSYATRNTEFTGRGNQGETLVTYTISPEKPVKLRKMDVTLDADASDVTALSVMIDGKVLGKVKVKAGKSDYRIRCRALIDDLADVNLCADIAEEATEGNTVSADIVKVRIDGKWVPVQAPAPGSREILLRRVKVLGQGYYNTTGYRIPAIECLQDGTLLITTDRRKDNDLDLPEDIDIIAQRSTDGGRTWSDPVNVIEGQGWGKGYGDAALIQAEDGTIACAFSGGPGLWASNLENPQRNYISLSHDGGLTWEEPFDCTSMLWGPDAVNPECKECHSAFFGSGHGLRMTKGEHAGRIMFVAAVHSSAASRFYNYAFYSDDNGKTWQVSKCAFDGGDEAKVVELADGRIMMSVRRRGFRGYNISEDGGHTWGEQGLWEDICTNACDGDIINVGDSLLLQSVPNSMERRNVSVFMSRDNGQSWPQVKSLCKYESVYSSLAILPDGTIGAYIEENPRVEFDMYFLNFSVDWLVKGEE